MPENPSFTEDQKQYLEGFIAGIARKRGMPLPNGMAPDTTLAPPPSTPDAEPSNDPSTIHRAAQDRAVAAGGKLLAEE